MNKKKWDSLTPEQQKIIAEAAHEALVWQRAETVKLEKLAWQAFRDRGITIHMGAFAFIGTCRRQRLLTRRRCGFGS